MDCGLLLGQFRADPGLRYNGYHRDPLLNSANLHVSSCRGAWETFYMRWRLEPLTEVPLVRSLKLPMATPATVE